VLKGLSLVVGASSTAVRVNATRSSAVQLIAQFGGKVEARLVWVHSFGECLPSADCTDIVT